MKNRRFFIMCLAAMCCGQHLFSQQKPQVILDAKTRSVVIDSVSHSLLKNYIFPDIAKETIDYIRRQQKSGAYDTVTNPNRFAGLLGRDARKITNDKHLNFIYNPSLEKEVLEPQRPSSSKPRPTVDLRQLQENFGFNKLEILPGNIGYISFTSFDDTSEQARNTIRSAMQFVSNTVALIIDLRSNYGGSGPMVPEITSYFFKERTYGGRNYSSITKSWAESYIENNPKVTHGLYLGMPVYLLTSNKTISAAEAFGYTLQTLRKAFVVGEVTVGSVHLTRTFAIGNGFIGFIPIMRGENAITKTDVENKGIQPDIAVSQDSALWKAGEYILTKKLDTTKAADQKNKITWELNALKGETHHFTVSKEVLEQYVGDFDGIIFKMNGDELMYTDAHSNNKTDVLKPITNTFFQVDFQAQVEFIKDSDGKISSIKLFWNDGWVDTLRKTIDKK